MLGLRPKAPAHVAAFDYSGAGGGDSPHFVESGGRFNFRGLERLPLLEDSADLLRAVYGGDLRGSLQQPHLIPIRLINSIDERRLDKPVRSQPKGSPRTDKVFLPRRSL